MREKAAVLKQCQKSMSMSILSTVQIILQAYPCIFSKTQDLIRLVQNGFIFVLFQFKILIHINLVIDLSVNLKCFSSLCENKYRYNKRRYNNDSNYVNIITNNN